MEIRELTDKELGFVEECLKMEALCTQKLQCYERETNDGELRQICRQGIESSRRHIDELLTLLR